MTTIKKYGFNSTTDDVLYNINLTGKRVIVTGGTSGLGEETARALASKGADVTIVGRNKEKLIQSAARIKAVTGHTVEIGCLELDKPESIHRFAKEWLSNHQTLDLLINNAGVLGCPLTYTKQGYELQFSTNHLGHFLLTNLVMSALKSSGNARVVNLSSSGHYVSEVDFSDIHYINRLYTPMQAYGQSKTANIWFSNELDRRFKTDGVRSFALHPGGINTNIGRHITPVVMDEITSIIQSFDGAGDEMKTISQGAATTCWAATSAELNGEGGLYLADCQIGKEGSSISTDYASHAFDEKKEKQLWEVSNKMLGTNF